MIFQAQICTNDYFAPNHIPAKREFYVITSSSEWTTNEVEHPGCLSSHGNFLVVWRSNFEIFWSTHRFPARDEHGVVGAF